DSAAESFVAGGSVLVGQTAPQSAAWTRGGSEVSDGATAFAGDILTVDLGAENSSTGLVVSARLPVAGAFADSAGIVVQGQVSDSLWEALGVLHPRRRLDDLALAV